MSARAAFAAACAVVVAAAVVPWDEGPLQRLAGAGEAGRTPEFDVPLEVGMLRKLEPRVENDATYFVDAADEPPLVQGNLKAVGQLYLARALPVQDRRRADYVVGLNGREVVLGRR